MKILGNPSNITAIKVYLVTYDLHGGKTEDYSELLTEIKDYEHCTVNLQSAYLIKSSLSANEIAVNLRKTTDKEFSLIITEIPNDNSCAFFKNSDDSNAVERFIE